MKRRKHSEMPPCCQIHLKGLASIGEDVEGNLGSLLLQVRDELLQQRDPVNLQGEQEEGGREEQDERHIIEEVRFHIKITLRFNSLRKIGLRSKAPYCQWWPPPSGSSAGRSM